MASCTKVDNRNKEDASDLPVAAAGLPQGRSCGSMEVLKNNLAQEQTNSELQAKQNVATTTSSTNNTKSTKIRQI